jgi:hypothetical protein
MKKIILSLTLFSLLAAQSFATENEKKMMPKNVKANKEIKTLIEKEVKKQVKKEIVNIKAELQAGDKKNEIQNPKDILISKLISAKSEEGRAQVLRE